MTFHLKCVLLLAAVVSGACACYLSLDVFRRDRMTRYYAYGFFARRLHQALDGGFEDRRPYYRIPGEYPLDGEYAESFSEGLALLIEKFGLDRIQSEINASDAPGIGFYMRSARRLAP